MSRSLWCVVRRARARCNGTRTSRSIPPNSSDCDARRASGGQEHRGPLDRAVQARSVGEPGARHADLGDCSGRELSPERTAASVSLRLRCRLLRKSRRRSADRRQSARPGFSGRSLPAMGSGHRSGERGRRARGEPAHRSRAGARWRRAKADAATVPARTGRPCRQRPTVLELDLAGRRNRRHAVHLAKRQPCADR